MKKFIPIIIIITMIFTTALVSMGVENSEPTSEKEEVVYGILDFEGNVEEVYVVNSFTDQTIIDYGRYSGIINMTSSEEIMVDGDRITVNTEEEQFFYQGTLDNKALPWNIDLEYTLNGEAMDAEELGGRDGEVEIIISVTKNNTVDPVFHNYYVMQISISLDTEKFTEIESPDGVFASAGRNRIISHTILPDEDTTVTVKADVRNFSMKEIEFSALPFSMAFDIELDEDLVDDTEILTDAVEQLYNGIRELNAGINELYDGGRSLNQGNSELGKGLEELSQNSPQLIQGSQEIGRSLQRIAGELQETDDFFPDENPLLQMVEMITMLSTYIDETISSLPDHKVDFGPLYQAVEGNEELTGSLNQLRVYYETSRGIRENYQKDKVSIDEMNRSIGEMLELMDSFDGPDQMQELSEGIAMLSESYQQFQVGLEGALSGIQELSQGQRELQGGYESLAEGLSELGSGADELEKGTGELNEGVSDLPATIRDEIDKMTAQYDYSGFEPVSFVSGKNTAVSLVQFVFKTPEILGAEVENGVIEEPEPLNFWQRVLKLFGLYDEKS